MLTCLVVWHSGSVISEVNLRWAQLVLGWVTVSRFNAHCLTFISVCIGPGVFESPSDERLRLQAKTLTPHPCLVV